MRLTDMRRALRSGRVIACKQCSYVHPGERDMRAAFRNARLSAKNHGKEFALHEAQVAFLISQPCIYCGADSAGGWKRSERALKYNGLDRYQPNSSYGLGLVVPCCWQCNRAKGQMKLREWSKYRARLGGHPEEAGPFYEETRSRILPLTMSAAALECLECDCEADYFPALVADDP